MKAHIFLFQVILIICLVGCESPKQQIRQDSISMVDNDTTIAPTDFFREIFNTDSTIYGDYLVSTPFDIDSLKHFLSSFDRHLAKEEANSVVIDKYWKDDLYFAICWKEDTYTIRYGLLTAAGISLRNGLSIGCTKADCESLFNRKINRDTIAIIDESGMDQITCYFNNGKLSALEFACFE